MSQFVWRDLFLWTYAGVNNSLVGNGGQECAEFISTFQKIVETIVFSLIGIVEICYAWPRLTLPSKVSSVSGRVRETGRRVMLMVMCLTFGIELGFKLASQQFIWILNPCHLVTMIQIFLLAAPPSRLVTALFRIQMHCLNGATIAILFPIVNTRLLPFETETYYLQHFLMLVVPYYLMRSGGPFTVETMGDFTWVIFTLGVLFIYHWLPLQLLAMLSLVNLNNMMCPAVSDPFYSRWYRIGAATHQTALIFVHGKLYTLLCSFFLPSRHMVDECSLSPTATKKPTDAEVAVAFKRGDALSNCNGYSKTQ